MFSLTWLFRKEYFQAKEHLSVYFGWFWEGSLLPCSNLYELGSFYFELESLFLLKFEQWSKVDFFAISSKIVPNSCGGFTKGQKGSSDPTNLIIFPYILVVWPLIFWFCYLKSWGKLFDKMPWSGNRIS